MSNNRIYVAFNTVKCGECYTYFTKGKEYKLYTLDETNFFIDDSDDIHSVTDVFINKNFILKDKQINAETQQKSNRNDVIFRVTLEDLSDKNRADTLQLEMKLEEGDTIGLLTMDEVLNAINKLSYMPNCKITKN